MDISANCLGEREIGEGMARVLIAEDHPLFRDALHQVVDDSLDSTDVVEAGTLAEAQEIVGSDPDLDLILLDIDLPGAEGFSGLISIRNLAPSIPVVVVTGSANNSALKKALACGAMGFIPKSLARERMVGAIRSVIEGEIFSPDAADLSVSSEEQGADPAAQDKVATLTQAELRVYELLAQGKPNKIIAYELDIKESTVKAHISSILRKMGVFSRTQAVLLANKIVFGPVMPRH
ncbi:MAG: response regulator [Magnetospiraceae bacterium]